MNPSNPAVRQIIQNFIDCGSIAGALFLAADGERVRSLDCAGYANLAARRPLTPDALFWVASMTKPLTATAFMLLADEGRAGLGDAVEYYLPEFGQLLIRTPRGELRPPKHPVTISELLSHTSGLPFSSPAELPTLDLHPLAVTATSYARERLCFEPGEGYLYSNEDINTVGRVIELVSGKSYADFLRERLLDPLGMTDTTFWPDAAQLARLATAYQPAPDRRLVETRITQMHYPLGDRAARHAFPAGGIFSTAADFLSFSQMLLNGGVHRGRRIISEAAIRELSARHSPPTVNEAYGLGFNLGPGWFGHGGAYSTQFCVHPARQVVTVYLIQQAGWVSGDPAANLNVTLTAAL
ncbi:MAG: beta-lactamase family protein [Verrucomicrobiales bacterium]|jgi:CubicO group peptidase (beta-lactamase class C family)|nr:beta-lactamase family protein [Verrucomicrobiales bacterium]